MPRNVIAYDSDFFAWTEEQARLLRAGELAEIDALNLAEEIESVGRSETDTVLSLLTNVLGHKLRLLGWPAHPRDTGRVKSVPGSPVWLSGTSPACI